MRRYDEIKRGPHKGYTYGDPLGWKFLLVAIGIPAAPMLLVFLAAILK